MPRVMSPQVLAKTTLQELLRLSGNKPRLLVAFSGGLDSAALTHLLVNNRHRLGDLRLAHVDHGLQALSSSWARHCTRQARSWRVPLVILEAKLRVPRGESLEAAARDARYSLLAKELRAGEVLVTAQHQDDQVETVLLQLFRGAGVAGLSAMPAWAQFGAGHIARPLLAATRADLEHYARRHRLTWVEDPTNRHDQFGRNFLRLKVMPLLRTRWPAVDVLVARTAHHMAEAGRLLGDTAARDLMTTADGEGLNVAALRALSLPRRRNLIRTIVARAGLDMPSQVKLREIVALLTVRPDAQPEVRWPGAIIQRRAGRLVLRADPVKESATRIESGAKSWHWARDRVFVLDHGGGTLALVDDDSGPIDLARLPRSLHLRPRQGGETLRPGPRARSQALKKLMQAARLTVEQRAQLPLVFAGATPKGRLIAAGDRWIDASVTANVKSRRRARLVWTRPA